MELIFEVYLIYYVKFFDNENGNEKKVLFYLVRFNERVMNVW